MKYRLQCSEDGGMTSRCDEGTSDPSILNKGLLFLRLPYARAYESFMESTTNRQLTPELVDTKFLCSKESRLDFSSKQQQQPQQLFAFFGVLTY